jgi:hypothetical protein
MAEGLRDSVLKFYKLYVRPWLDLIDVTRKLLRVLAVLHVPFARELDARLGRLQQWIERPFRILLAQINAITNIINRIVTLDGLLQRLTLIRSLARDYQYAWRAITEPYNRPVSEADRAAMRLALAAAMIAAGMPAALAMALITRGVEPKTPATIEANARAYLKTGDGVDAPLLNEMTLIWRNALRRQS